MSHRMAHMIRDGLNLSLFYAEQLLAGTTDDNFARLATPGGQTVVSNHPAFVIGHLALYPPKIQTLIGQPVRSLPEGFEQVFSKDARCVDDPEGDIYPDRTVIVDSFLTSYQEIVRQLDSVSDETLQAPNPFPGRMSEKFPGAGSMAAFLTSGHMMLHLGQLSAWRRMQGLGPAV